MVVCKTTEVRRTVDDLHRLLAEAADRAAQQAQAPGAAVAVRRARTRRRWAAAIRLCAAGGGDSRQHRVEPWRSPVADDRTDHQTASP